MAAPINVLGFHSLKNIQALLVNRSKCLCRIMFLGYLYISLYFAFHFLFPLCKLILGIVGQKFLDTRNNKLYHLEETRYMSSNTCT